MTTRIAILISGRGSNMVALADAKIPNAEIALVISDHADAPGLAIARERGLKDRKSTRLNSSH